MNSLNFSWKIEGGEVSPRVDHMVVTSQLVALWSRQQTNSTSTTYQGSNSEDHAGFSQVSQRVNTGACLATPKGPPCLHYCVLRWTKCSVYQVEDRSIPRGKREESWGLCAGSTGWPTHRRRTVIRSLNLELHFSTKIIKICFLLFIHSVRHKCLRERIILQIFVSVNQESFNYLRWLENPITLYLDWHIWILESLYFRSFILRIK